MPFILRNYLLPLNFLSFEKQKTKTAESQSQSLNRENLYVKESSDLVTVGQDGIYSLAGVNGRDNRRDTFGNVIYISL